MRLSFSLLAACTLGASLAAQNNFILYPDDARSATSVASRYSFGALAGEMLQQVPASALAGIGDNGTACQVTNMSFILQDQNNATQENYTVIFRSATGTGAPDATPTGIIAQSSSLLSPLGTGGVAAYLVTVTFTSPLALPCTGDYFFGVSFTAASGWTTSTDGISIHNAYNPPTGTLGSNARSTAPTIAWQIFDPGTGTAAFQASSARVANIALGTAAPVLAIGNRDPLSTRSTGGIDYGLGGLYPAVKLGTRDDGLDARINDTPSIGGVGVVFVGLGSFGPAIPIPGFLGRVYLDLTFPVIEFVAASITGTTVGYGKVQLASPGVIPSSPGVTLYFQAFTVDSGFANPRISNAIAVSF